MPSFPRLAFIAVVLQAAGIAGKAQVVQGWTPRAPAFPSGALTLGNAILQAGGVEDWGHAERVQFTRQRDGGVRVTVGRDHLLLKSGDTRLDPVRQEGDRIFLPKRFIQW